MLRLRLCVFAMLLVGCDPTATRLSPTKLDFLFAAHTRSFDLQGNLLLTGYDTPQLVRLDRERLEFQNISQGLPEKEFPAGEIFADGRGNLAAGGWFRGVDDAAWSQLPTSPAGTLVYTFDGAGTVWALGRTEPSLVLYRLQPPGGPWEDVGSLPDQTNVESATFRARLDGTVFIGNQRVWVKGAAESTELLTCPTVRIDQACERGFQVFTHPRRNEIWLVAEPNPGLTKGQVFRVPEGATFPIDFDSLRATEVTEGRWRAVRMSADGALHVALLQKVDLDYPPYEADEATLYALDAAGARSEARLLWNGTSRPVVGDHRDIYQASAQFVGGTWTADPVYVFKF